MVIINDVKNPQWGNADKTYIILSIDFAHNAVELGEKGVYVDFYAMPHDDEAHGRELYARAIAGEFGVIADYVEPVKTQESLKQEKIAAINNATVEVDGLIFDANEQSLIRMMAAIQAADTFGINQSQWRMADNSEVVITLAQLKIAQAKTIQKIGAVILDNP